jgi:hypothetical protein
MSPFEFFMGFYGLLLGIGLAELLLSFGRLIRARTRPKIGLLTPALGALVFLNIVTSLIDAWLRLQHLRIDLFDMAIPIVIGVAYFLVAVTVVPDDHTEWQSLDEYFFARRKWTLGPILLIFLLTLCLEIPSTMRMINSADWPALQRYLTLNSVALLMITTSLLAKNPRVVLGAMIIQIAMLSYIYSAVLRILGLS